MVDHCTKHEQNALIHLKYITTNIQNVWNNGHKGYILAQSQGIFYMHQVPIVVDYCTKYEQNQHIHFRVITTLKMYEKMVIITQIWHRAKLYFRSLSNLWYLVTVPNMNKIATFFSEISQQTHKIYEKVAIITKIWHRAKRYFTSTCMSNAPYLVTLPNRNKITTFLSEISQQTLKMYETTHIYSKLALSRILFHVHQWPMVSDHGTQYEETLSSHHGWMDPFPIFPDSALVERGIFTGNIVCILCSSSQSYTEDIRLGDRRYFTFSHKTFVLTIYVYMYIMYIQVSQH